jgi:cathepsin D
MSSPYLLRAVAITNMTGGFLGAPASGIMGLGFQSVGLTQARPFVHSLLLENKLTSPVMSFFFARPNNTYTSSEEPGGTFTLGGTNQDLYSGEIEYLPLVSADAPRHWSLALSRGSLEYRAVGFSA